MSNQERTVAFKADNKQQVLEANNVLIGTYSYDGEGKRVKKVTDTETTVYVFSSGKWVAEYSTAAPPATPTVNYTATDQLGSPRVLTNSLSEVVSRRDFLPFGEEIFADGQSRTTGNKYSATGQDTVRKRFTGYEKDPETGLDFAEARMYQNKHGRFTAVDPLIASTSPGDPQTFNRYTHTGNNPINRTDPSGLDWCIGQGTGPQDITKVKGRCDEDLKTLTERDEITLRRGSLKATNGTATPADTVRFNANGTITIIKKANDAQLAQATGAHVQAGEEQIKSDPAAGQAVMNATISPPTMLALPPCPPGAGCRDVSSPSAPSIDMGASADEVLDAAQTTLEALGMVPGLEIADIASGAISGFRGDYSGMFLSAGAVVPVGGQAFTGIKWARRLERARELGIAGEQAAGLTGAAKRAIKVDGRNLFPDEITDTMLTEVKNVKRLSLTRQLKDYGKYAQSKPQKLDFVLFTRNDTILYGPLMDRIRSGDIIHKCFDGPCKQF